MRLHPDIAHNPLHSPPGTLEAGDTRSAEEDNPVVAVVVAGVGVGGPAYPEEVVGCPRQTTEVGLRALRRIVLSSRYVSFGLAEGVGLTLI